MCRRLTLISIFRQFHQFNSCLPTRLYSRLWLLLITWVWELFIQTSALNHQSCISPKYSSTYKAGSFSQQLVCSLEISPSSFQPSMSSFGCTTSVVLTRALTSQTSSSSHCQTPLNKIALTVWFLKSRIIF